MDHRELLGKEELSEEESACVFNGMCDELWPELLPQQIHIGQLPARTSSNVVTTTDTPVPECSSCGLCCTAFVRIPAEPESKVEDDETIRVIKSIGEFEIVVDRFIKRDPNDFRCTKLEGEPGVAVSCSIYERRPNSCRVFEAGSDRCHAIRRAYGLEPFLTTSEMSAALERLDERDQMKGTGETLVDSVRFAEASDGQRVSIEVVLTDESEMLIHEFDPARETWYKSQFEGMTVFEAKRLLGKHSDEKMGPC